MDVVVHVVDDDQMVRDALHELFRQNGYGVEVYPSAEKFLASYSQKQPGCMVLDLQMDGMSGVELQCIMIEKSIMIPIIFLTGFATVDVAVSAIKNGAHDFVEKPFTNETLLEKVSAAVQISQSSYDANRKYQKLTRREKEVFALLISGKSNKALSAKLDLSISTVEFHRKNIMLKLSARSLEDLVSLNADL